MSRHVVIQRVLAHTALVAAVLSALSACAMFERSEAPAAAAALPTPTEAPAAPSNGGVATTPSVTSAAPGNVLARPTPAATPAVTPSSPPLRPFADVAKDFTEGKGFIPVWTKDERVLLEIHPNQLSSPMFFGGSLAQGLGEAFFLPGLMGQEHIVEFKRIGNVLQLIAKNQRVRAPAGTPLAGAIAESYSDSLLASTLVLSAAHPKRKTFLVDAAALFIGDIPGVLTRLETAFRLPYSVDRANSSVAHARTDDQGVSVTVKTHYVIPKLPAPPVVVPGAPPPNPATLPRPPRVVPDARSLFVAYTYSLSPLPERPMAARRADERVGHFTDAFLDLGNDLGLDTRTHFVNRWRLEKTDPSAPVSEPKAPIVAIMDRNIPEKYRASIRDGIVEWNKAFERVGFKDAVVVKQQTDDDKGSTVEHGRHLAVRWFAMEGPGATAVGPSQTDPRTGEILRGAAIIPESWARIGRATLSETLPKPSAAISLEQLLDPKRLCSYASDALEQASFGLEVLAARGVLDPTGPEADRFIAEALKDVTMHEVGHALGLRHNFKASTGVKLAQLRDVATARSRGISNSVMDYNAYNIPLEDEAPTVYNMVTLGEYDYWAIEYAYTPLAPEAEKAELAKIAARQSANPALAYATDEDAIAAIDPTANQWDLGDDPLAYQKRRMALSRELWTRTQNRELKDGDSFALYRRNVVRGLNQFGVAANAATKYVGGVATSREVPGAAGDRALFAPVPAAKQREALALLTTEVLSSDSFRFDPKFMRRLGVDQLDRFAGAEPVLNTDFSLATTVLGIQRSVLDRLMSDAVALRLADAETKVTLAERRRLMSFADVQSTLSDAVWSELNSGRDIDSMRRNLQREHVRRLAGAMLRPASAVATDVRSVQRQVAIKLEADLRRAVASRQGGAVTRAHLSESQAILAEALKATLIRVGA